jgi:AcrR family transcriptional regulator
MEVKEYMRLTKDDVITTASEIADKYGLDHVTLKAVAEKLNIRTPSLYNHIDSLEDLLRDIAHRGMREMNARMTQAAIGVSGVEAIKSVSLAYFDYLIAHPGVYEIIQWAGWHGNSETVSIFSEYRVLLEKIILSCHLKNPDTGAIIDLLTGFLHGYCTLQLGNALNDRDAATKKIATAVDTVMRGITSTNG